MLSPQVKALCTTWQIWASEKKVDFCKKLGADQVIDYKYVKSKSTLFRKEKYEESLKDIDMCFDTCEELPKCFAITKNGGKVITIGAIPSS